METRLKADPKIGKKAIAAHEGRRQRERALKCAEKAKARGRDPDDTPGADVPYWVGR